MLRPRGLLGIAFAAVLVLVAAAYNARSPDCQEPFWFPWVFWTFGPLSLGAAIAAVIAFGIGRGWAVTVSVVAALPFAALWTFGAYVLLVLTAVESHCFD